jgi:hypothetical protein
VAKREAVTTLEPAVIGMASVFCLADCQHGIASIVDDVDGSNLAKGLVLKNRLRRHRLLR